MNTLTDFGGAVTPQFDRWTHRAVCDLDDPLTADLVVEGSIFHHEIKITIWGAVGSIDPAIEAAAIALDAYASAIAAEARPGGRAA